MTRNCLKAAAICLAACSWSGCRTQTVTPSLVCARDGARTRVRGRFGVFHLGRIVLEAYDAQGRVLASEILVPNATPLEPIVLDRTLELPSAARRVAVVLQDRDGKRIGPLARGIISAEPR